MARERDNKLEVVKLPEAKRGIVLLAPLWGRERNFGCVPCFRRLALDNERLPEILAGLRCLAFIILVFKNVVEALT